MTRGDGDAAAHVYLLLHGGAACAASFALLAARLKAAGPVVAVDLLCHGESWPVGDADTCREAMVGLSARSVTSQVLRTFRSLLGSPVGTALHRPVVVVGHSMGAGIAVKVANELENVAGVVMMEMVEEVAVDNLDGFADMLKGRPTGFVSPAGAVDWSLRSGLLRERASAEISVPPLLERIEAGGVASAAGGAGGVAGGDSSLGDARGPSTGAAGDSGRPAFKWRSDLCASRDQWRGWFDGVDAAFLALTVPKMLVLANSAAHLDRALTIAQMQGKFKLVVVPRSGHFVHEDRADEVAEAIATFVARQLSGRGGAALTG